MPFIQVENLVKSYPRRGEPSGADGRTNRSAGLGQTVLNELSFSMESNEFTALFGASGSGKSTLLHILGGLDGDFQGRVTVDGLELSGAGDRELSGLRGHTVGFVLQSPFFLSYLDALQNIVRASRFGSRPADETRARTLLEDVGLKDFAHRFPDELSGGQLQRLALARAMASEPKLLLLDEPTGNLDLETAENLVRLLSRFHEAGGTLLVATHDERVARACRRRLVLQDGRIGEAL